ncbi:hypothetical protein [Flavilitoribacter nigricans]|uniref:hypothetical protein n=1 Tax=Flavilitoribacter nigricans TaxID=70997 RepID=UPI00117A725C|nr:hypothetical protein [Flavilitoribacter nigricans]
MKRKWIVIAGTDGNYVVKVLVADHGPEQIFLILDHDQFPRYEQHFYLSFTTGSNIPGKYDQIVSFMA